MGIILIFIFGKIILKSIDYMSMNGHEEISSIKKDVTYNSFLETVDYFPNTKLTFLVITFLNKQKQSGFKNL